MYKALGSIPRKAKEKKLIKGKIIHGETTKLTEKTFKNRECR